MEYKVGEKVIYPNQGVGIIEDICTKDIAGLQAEFICSGSCPTTPR